MVFPAARAAAANGARRLIGLAGMRRARWDKIVLAVIVDSWGGGGDSVAIGGGRRGVRLLRRLPGGWLVPTGPDREPPGDRGTCDARLPRARCRAHSGSLRSGRR